MPIYFQVHIWIKYPKMNGYFFLCFHWDKLLIFVDVFCFLSLSIYTVYASSDYMITRRKKVPKSHAAQGFKPVTARGFFLITVITRPLFGETKKSRFPMCRKALGKKDSADSPTGQSAPRVITFCVFCRRSSPKNWRVQSFSFTIFQSDVKIEVSIPPANDLDFSNFAPKFFFRSLSNCRFDSVYIPAFVQKRDSPQRDCGQNQVAHSVTASFRRRVLPPKRHAQARTTIAQPPLPNAASAHCSGAILRNASTPLNHENSVGPSRTKLENAAEPTPTFKRVLLRIVSTVLTQPQGQKNCRSNGKIHRHRGTIRARGGRACQFRPPAHRDSRHHKGY
jgi:hypothetical protein